MVLRLLSSILAALTGLSSDLFSIRHQLSLIRREQRSQREILQSIQASVVAEPAVTLIFSIVAGDLPPAKGIHMLQLTDSQKSTVSISAVDAKGAPALLDGAATFVSSDPAVFTVTPGTDGLSADVLAVNPGVAQLQVSADADLGTGTTLLSGTLDITVVAGAAVSISVTAGAPSEQ